MVDTITFDYQLLTDLIDASLSADPARIREVSSEVSFALEKSGDKKRAKEVRALIRKRGAGLEASRQLPRLPVDANSRQPLVEVQHPIETPLFLNERNMSVVSSFCEDAKNTDLLKENGLTSRLFLMLSGPPGTGKSLLANHVAALIEKPLMVARLDSLISSRLGETAKNIREVFDHIARRGGVLFLDEMDAIAKLRDDRHELGELKRVVNTVIQGLDSLPDEAIVIGATNHAHILDSAIWRRFPYSMEVELPELDIRSAMWSYFLFSDDPSQSYVCTAFAKMSEGLSGSDIEVLALASRRRSIFDKTSIDVFPLVEAIIASTQGKPSIPTTQPIPFARKQQIVKQLVNEYKLAKVKLSEVLGVSRQMIYKYLAD